MVKQICPTCGAANPNKEATCAICGARLSRTTSPARALNGAPASGSYEFALGEDDLMADHIPGVRWMMVGLLVLGMLLGVGLLWGVLRLSGADELLIQPVPTDTPSATTTPDFTASLLALTPTITLTPSLTRTPPPPLPTVTPTITLVPTEGPCEFAVAEGEGLYDLALKCGHRDYSVIPAIVELNKLTCDSCLQIGQIIQVPRPTATIDPAAIENPASGALDVDSAEFAAAGTVSADDIIAARQVALEPTLDPNLQYHYVEQGQTLWDVIAVYNIDVKLLSEINPEIEFPQCDFGERFGGPTCAVFFSEGQRLRVPAPTPTPTIPPTASGSETPTPSPTATINVPAVFAPREGANFDAASIVTLRWTTTGTLDRDEVYAVRVKNIDTNEEYIGITCDLAFDLPKEWQSRENIFQQYEWYVTVNTLTPFATSEETVYTVRGYDLCTFSYDLPIEWQGAVGWLRGATLANERYPTAKRRFFWQGRAAI